jgi:hypothetical protein
MLSTILKPGDFLNNLSYHFGIRPLKKTAKGVYLYNNSSTKGPAKNLYIFVYPNLPNSLLIFGISAL